MKKIKFLLLVVALFMSFGCISVSAETGKKPGTITTKEDLIYYIYYYGGMARLDGNTVKLTSSLELAQELSFNNTESVTLDLNGNGIYFSGSDSKIMVYENAKDVTITDSSNSDRDYIRSQSNFAIYNSSSVGVVTVSNTMLVTNSSLPAIYTYGFSKTNIVNTTVRGDKTGIGAGANSTVFLKNSKVSLGNPTGEVGIELANSNVTITNSDVNVYSGATKGIAIKSEGDRSNLIINSGKFNAYKSAVYVSEGKATINGGLFESNNNHAFRTSTNAVINGGIFKSNCMAGVQIMGASTNVVLNEGTFMAGSSSDIGGLALPLGSDISTYVGKTSIIDNDFTASKNGLSYTESKEVNISSLPKTKKLSTTTYTYNGYVREPNVTVTNNLGKKLVKGTDYKLIYQSGRKYVGKYYVQIIYLGKYKTLKSEKLYFTINPKGTYISNLSRGKKRLTVKVSKRTSQTTGYQIMYSSSKKFSGYKTVKMTNKTTSKTIKGLKSGKRYYVKVRTYKVSNGKTYYSSWSKVKSAVVK